MRAKNLRAHTHARRCVHVRAKCLCACVHMRAHMCASVHTCARNNLACARVCVCVRINACIKLVRARTCVHMRAKHLCACMHMRAYTCAYVHICARKKLAHVCV